MNWRQNLSNRLYAVPTVAQWWSKRAASQANQLAELTGIAPFAPLRKPLRECNAALITTAGVHLRAQPRFDMDNVDGDATYREVPATVVASDLMITHHYYDHRDADRDLNVVFPLAHFRDLASRGVIKSLAKRHFGFMGHIEGEQLTRLTRETALEVAAKLRKDGVDFAFLTPA